MDLNSASTRTKSGSVWYPLTVRRIAHNSTYTGKTYYGQTRRTTKTTVTARPKEEWTLLPDITPPIISQELFDLAQDAIARAKDRRPTKPNAAYLLTGFAKCLKCGSPLGGTMLQGKYRYYQCRGAKPTASRGKFCDAGYIKADQLEAAIWDKFVELVSSKTFLYFTSYSQPDQPNLLTVMDKDVARLRAKLKTYARRETKLVETLSEEAVTKQVTLDAINRLKHDKNNDERQLEGLLHSREQARAHKPEIVLTDVSEQLRLALSHHTDTDMLDAKRSLFRQLNVTVKATPQAWSITVDLGDIQSIGYRAGAEPPLDPHASTGPLVITRTDRSPLVGNDAVDMIARAGFNLVTIEQTSA